MGEFDGRVVVVTGGARGIGLAAVRRFLGAGATVALWDPRSAEAEDALRAEWPDASLHAADVDVRSVTAVRSAAETLVGATGRVDVLINNAGINIGRCPTVDVGEEAWRSVVDTNLTGTLHCTQAVVPHMIARRGGRIVNVSSVLAAYGHPEHAAYVASKSAIAGLTRSWAREFGRFGITVNTVSPGYIRTAMNAGTASAVVDQVAAATPLGRLGEADDVAQVFVWLASAGAAFVTGAVIPVDGGLMV
jgi:3-oxoacyl-[acyl-carrier protein] reductase